VSGDRFRERPSNEALQRFQERRITKRDAYELLRSPGYNPATEYEELIRPAMEAARVLPYEERAKLWNIPGAVEE
jgi:hypothetical protein